ncbi:MAG: hypothetical protein OHK0039_08120 [Bacteroidia bacterium]
MKLSTHSLRLTWLLVLPLLMGSLSPAPPAQRDYCKLAGVVFVEQVAAFAQHRVFVSDIEGLANLVVYKEDSEFMAQAPGHWYFTDVKALADFTIYLEETEAFADFTIAYTPFQTAAGCP